MNKKIGLILVIMLIAVLLFGNLKTSAVTAITIDDIVEQLNKMNDESDSEDKIIVTKNGDNIVMTIDNETYEMKYVQEDTPTFGVLMTVNSQMTKEEYNNEVSKSILLYYYGAVPVCMYNGNTANDSFAYVSSLIFENFENMKIQDSTTEGDFNAVELLKEAYEDNNVGDVIDDKDLYQIILLNKSDETNTNEYSVTLQLKMKDGFDYSIIKGAYERFSNDNNSTDKSEQETPVQKDNSISNEKVIPKAGKGLDYSHIFIGIAGVTLLCIITILIYDKRKE